MMQKLLVSQIFAIVLLLLASAVVQAFDLRQSKARRRPSAIAIDQHTNQAVIANRSTGSLSIVDLTRLELVHEEIIGTEITDIEAGVLQGQYLATDFKAHEIICFELRDTKPVVLWKKAVAKYPVSIAVNRKEKIATVSSLWSRRVTIIDLKSDDRDSQFVDLDFAPNAQCFVDDCLIVADAFGDRVAVIDFEDGQVKFSRQIPGHAPMTIALSNDRRYIVMAQSMLNELAHSVRNDVHWGLMVSNDIRWIDTGQLLDPEKDIYKGAVTRPLGGASDAKADPGAFVFSKDATAVITLGGVDQVAVGKLSDNGFSYINVGRRPVDLALFKQDQLAIVANQLDDSVSIINIETEETLKTIELGPKKTQSLADQGESLFFDARLSHDQWMSCHSCHTEGHTNGLLNDNFSDQSFGAPKRVLSLLGRHGTEPFAWNGSAATLDEQLRNSIEQTMQSGRKASTQNLRALAAYLKSLRKPPSIDEARGTVDVEAIDRGRKVFAMQKCNNCHQGDQFTHTALFEVGLKDQLGNKQFNPPSLNGVGQRYRLFHDNRAKSLDEVLAKYRHQLRDELSDQERKDLIAYLRSL